MRKERKIINTNIRLNLCDEQDQAGMGISSDNGQTEI